MSDPVEGKERLACPACGFMAFDGNEYGSGAVCPICAWRDDAKQLANPCTEGGANEKSLLDHQVDALERIPQLFIEYEGWHRDSDWRPLTKDEAVFHLNYKENNLWFFKEILDPERVYWRYWAMA